MEQESLMTSFFISVGLAILLNGLASIGPVLTTYSGEKDCNENDIICKQNKGWTLGIGIFALIFGLIITSMSIFFIKRSGIRVTY
jgi:hypothetical protein